jgi:hypothetical protein
MPTDSTDFSIESECDIDIAAASKVTPPNVQMIKRFMATFLSRRFVSRTVVSL